MAYIGVVHIAHEVRMSIPTWPNHSSWRYVITMDEESHLHIVVWLDFDVAGPVDIFLVNSRMPFDGF